MFRGVNPLVQAVRRVIVQNRHGLLRDDRPAVHAGVHEMHGAARDFHAVIQRLFPGFQPGKRGQQRRMDIYDAALESPQEFSLQHAHEPGQHKQINLRFLQRADISALGVFIEFRAELARGDESRGKVSPSCLLQDARVFHVTDDDTNLGRDFARGDGTGDGCKVRSLSRTKNPEAKSVSIVHEVFLQATIPRRQASIRRAVPAAIARHRAPLAVVHRRLRDSIPGWPVSVRPA